MDKVQQNEHGDLIQKWKDAASRTAVGWDEDEPEIPLDYWINVNMARYHVGGLFQFDDGKNTHLITNPVCDISVRVNRIKAHMNRMIRAVEFARDNLLPEAGNLWEHAVNLWEFTKAAVDLLDESHHGKEFKVMARGMFTTTLHAHATGLPSSLPWDVGIGFRRAKSGDLVMGEQYLFHLRTTVLTVCPFVLFETNGKQSHTQRTHIGVDLWTDAPVIPGAIMREITTRLVPVMSCMKVPDEVIQVLKAYTGPTYTEDAAVRVIKMLRGITAEFCPEGKVLNCKVTATSEDSPIAHDIVTTLENDLQ